MNHFTHRLLEWNACSNTRSMPWKGESDPYKIWLSEIILQQTRVEQGRRYYEAFTKKYPTIQHLAAANDDGVFKLWEGLGYYSRCRNLLASARCVVDKYDGKFPERYDDILKLKGVGPYSAAAIASFAYNLPYAVLDGNVYRVLSRVYGIQTATDTTEGNLQFQELALKNLDASAPAIYNQAIMDFGATICKPLPACGECVMQDICIAFKENLVSHLPVKQKKLVKKDRFFTQFVMMYKDEVLVNKRMAKDIWKDLYEFYVEESDKAIQWNEKTIEQFFADRFQVRLINRPIFSNTYTQLLTHQTIHTRFVVVPIRQKNELLKKFHWVKVRSVNELPFPKTAKTFIDEDQAFRAFI